MHSPTLAAPLSRTRVRAGWILSALPALFLLMDAVMKLMRVEPVLQSMSELGYPTSLAFAIGLLELLCLALYVIPRTSVLGAILLTGYLGGAIATHVRIGSPLVSHTLFPVYIGVLLWAGLYLRDARLRLLVPLKSET